MPPLVRVRENRPMSGTLTVTLPPGDRAPRAARSALDRFVAGHLGEPHRSDVRLLVTELVTNGVLHGQGDVRLEAELRPGSLHVEVIDGGDGIGGRSRSPDLEREGGFGLVIVDSLADRWGVFAGSTHVWFEVDAAAPVQ